MKKAYVSVKGTDYYLGKKARKKCLKKGKKIKLVKRIDENTEAPVVYAVSKKYGTIGMINIGSLHIGKKQAGYLMADVMDDEIKAKIKKVKKRNVICELKLKDLKIPKKHKTIDSEAEDIVDQKELVTTEEQESEEQESEEQEAEEQDIEDPKAEEQEAEEQDIEDPKAEEQEIEEQEVESREAEPQMEEENEDFVVDFSSEDTTPSWEELLRAEREKAEKRLEDIFAELRPKNVLSEPAEEEFDLKTADVEAALRALMDDDTDEDIFEDESFPEEHTETDDLSESETGSEGTEGSCSETAEGSLEAAEGSLEAAEVPGEAEEDSIEADKNLLENTDDKISEEVRTSEDEASFEDKEMSAESVESTEESFELPLDSPKKKKKRFWFF